MFERFTEAARQTVVLAQQEARALHSGHIGTEHLLLGLIGQGGTPVADVLDRHGLNRASAVQSIVRFSGGAGLDAEALGAVGIDLDAVRARVEETFGPGALDAPGRGRGKAVSGHIPFTPRAKKVLELSLREALALKSPSIGDGHILLGMLREGEGLAMKVLADRGIDTATLREEIRSALRASA
jgi:ATP-dependent Clp protease ATP-binding subunit ClpA